MNTSADAVALSVVRYCDPRVRALVDEVQAEYVVMYGSPDETPIDPGQFDAPDGLFLLAEVGGTPIGCGGWRAVGSGTAEIKRMFVSNRGRRRGLARAILAELERSARAAGRVSMVLETGLEQPPAIALYRAAGYADIPGYGHYRCSPSSVSLGKPL